MLIISNEEQTKLEQVKSFSALKVYFIMRDFQREGSVTTWDMAGCYATNAFMRYSELRQATGISQTQMNRIVKELSELELIYKTKAGIPNTHGYYTRYRNNFEAEPNLRPQNKYWTQQEHLADEEFSKNYTENN